MAAVCGRGLYSQQPVEKKRGGVRGTHTAPLLGPSVSPPPVASTPAWWWMVVLAESEACWWALAQAGKQGETAWKITGTNSAKGCPSVTHVLHQDGRTTVGTQPQKKSGSDRLSFHNKGFKILIKSTKSTFWSALKKSQNLQLVNSYWCHMTECIQLFLQLTKTVCSFYIIHCRRTLLIMISLP